MCVSRYTSCAKRVPAEPKPRRQHNTHKKNTGWNKRCPNQSRKREAHKGLVHSPFPLLVGMPRILPSCTFGDGRVKIGNSPVHHALARSRDSNPSAPASKDDIVPLTHSRLPPLVHLLAFNATNCAPIDQLTGRPVHRFTHSPVGQLPVHRSTG